MKLCNRVSTHIPTVTILTLLLLGAWPLASESDEPSNQHRERHRVSVYNVVRSVYLVPTSKASGLVQFLTDSITADVDVRILEGAEAIKAMGPMSYTPGVSMAVSVAEQPMVAYRPVQVTALAEVQDVVNDLVKLMWDTGSLSALPTAAPIYPPTYGNQFDAAQPYSPVFNGSSNQPYSPVLKRSSNGEATPTYTPSVDPRTSVPSSKQGDPPSDQVFSFYVGFAR